ncbi:MAG: GntR family transcriptional regulator [Burkholderiaceae bacterium]
MQNLSSPRSAGAIKDPDPARLRAPPAPLADPVRRPLHEEAAWRLREMIIEGRLAAGSRLNERVLSEQLQVSRTPLREAFKVLAGERLIELSPNRGAMVIALDRDDVWHLFELMGSLEGLVGELAAQRRTDTELAEIRALHFEMLAAHARRDLPAYYRLNRAIHDALKLAARNPALADTYDSVNGRLHNLRFRSNFDRLKWDAAVLEHEQMIAALAAGDATRLRALLETHLRTKRDAVLAGLADGGPAVTGTAGTAVPYPESDR